MHDSQFVSPLMQPGESIPFVGRERELATLRQALVAAQAGQRRIALLSGEPGIGKTRLADAVANDAVASSFQVFRGSCHEWDGAPAFWPWIQIIRSTSQTHDIAGLKPELGARFDSVVQLVPDISGSEGAARADSMASGDAARFLLFDGVTALLSAIAQVTPIALVLEDLHWSDAPSLLLLQFIAHHTRDVPLLLLGTYRSADPSPKHPLTDVVSNLIRVPGTTRIDLHGLEPNETRALIKAVAGKTLSERAVDALRYRAEGNPLFAVEMSRFLLARGDLTSSGIHGGLVFQVPQSVRDVLSRRLRRLSDGCRETLAAASVIGREFSAPLLVSVCGQSVDAVLAWLDEAVESRLVDLGASVGSYQFHHALIQEILYADLAPGRRMRLHQQAGEALEKLHAHNLDPLLDELAYHFFHALPAGDPDPALQFLTRAAERSLAQLAWESAVHSYERALQASDLVSEQDFGAKCRLLLALGDAQMLGERSLWGSPAARETFLRAAELARAMGDAEGFARAALGFAGRNPNATPGMDLQVELLEEALRRLGREDSALRARVLGRLAIDRNVIDLQSDPLARTNPSSRIHRLSDEAIAVARSVGDPATLAFTLLAKRVSCATHDNVGERIRLSDDAIWLTETSADAEIHWRATMFNFWDYSELGDLEKELNAFERYIEQTCLTPNPLKEWGVLGFRAQYALREGDFLTAEDLAWRALGNLPLAGSPWLLFHLRREQERLHEIERDLEQISSFQLLWRARETVELLLALELGREDARERFENLAARDFADIPVTERRLDALILLAEACIIIDDKRRAEILYDLMLPYKDRVAAILVHFSHHGAVARFLGMLATQLSRWDEAETHFATALEINERMRLRPFAAHTRHEWAKMLVKRGDPADVARAHDLNDHALRIAREIGMTRLERMAKNLASNVVRPERGACIATPTGLKLTRRESEVLRLVSLGKSSREIADDLFLSTRTVERHVENLYRKLDVHSRAEAIAFALRQEAF